LLPGLGAPAAPDAWHRAHVFPNTDLPTALSASGAAAVATTAGVVTAGVAIAAGASGFPQATSAALQISSKPKYFLLMNESFCRNANCRKTTHFIIAFQCFVAKTLFKASNRLMYLKVC
jgi:hypothetical protein